jgi:peroxiredoxin
MRQKGSDRLLLLAVALSMLAGWAFSPAPAGSAERPIELRDVDGRTHTPLSQPGSKAIVCFFLLPDCPISNAYAPEIKRICAAYAPKHVTAFLVHADPDTTAEQAKKHAQEYALTCPVLLDPSHRLVKRTGVTVAPEVAVLSPVGKVLYRGRIDDWYVDYGRRRAEPTQRDLRNALDAILQGKAVPVAETKALGCHLPEGKK